MISLFRDFKDINKNINKSIVAIGNFDGLHHGHHAVLNHAKFLKKENGSKLIILTFYPHPLKVLRPGKEPKNILSFRNKVSKMEKIGIDILLAQRFNINFSKFTPLDFIKKVLVDGLNASDIIIGDDFHFGYKRQGNVEYLMSKEFQKYFKVHIIREVSGINGRYSSSLVRDMILSGKMMEAKEVLGYFYEVEGRVVKGEQLGNKLGFPTANINYLNTIIPSDGIYAGW
ncbi:MAG: riboflavin kinase, partial [Alphaproteobacteria bacterium]|nr:riboflavin kinase [Alphaproteobacteria bacterium]